MAKKVINEEIKIINEDPFLAGRKEAAERYGFLSKNAAQWRLMTIILLFLCVFCVVMIVRISASRTVVPYIIQVDSHGYEVAIAPVAPSKIDSRLVIARVGRYVKSLKTVYNDVQAQMELMNFVYLTTPSNTPAQTRYIEYYQMNNPMEISGKYQVLVTINSVLSLSEKKWQCEWTEQGLNKDSGNSVFKKQYRGIFDVAINTPTNMKEILENPLGIFITDFNFSEITS
jgi:type IV secretion system protein VirB5